MLDAVIQDYEAKGYKFLFKVPLPITPDSQLQLRKWEQAARRKNCVLTEYHSKSEVLVFYNPVPVFPAPKNKAEVTHIDTVEDAPDAA